MSRPPKWNRGPLSITNSSSAACFSGSIRASLLSILAAAYGRAP